MKASLSPTTLITKIFTHDIYTSQNHIKMVNSVCYEFVM